MPATDAANDALVLLVFVPLLAACVTVIVPPRWRALPVMAVLGAMPILLLVVTQAVLSDGVLHLVIAGFQPPLGISLRADGLALTLLWLVALVGGAAGVHAMASHPPEGRQGGQFWPLWLLLLAGLNGLFLSADLFNLYVALELVTLTAIALIATDGEAGALRAAMRYLLLAMLASLAYLLGVALLYAEHGTLDLYALATGVGSGRAGATTPAALALITVAMLLKAAIFPLHIWLPPAHAQAPGAVSAVLSALVVKTAIYLLYRLWFWTAADVDLGPVSLLLGILGAGAVLFGSLAALVQDHVKRVVAYSTVAQLGYLMLVFPLLGDPRTAPGVWVAAGCHVFAHGLAKAGMFLAAANLVRGVGSGRLDRLAGSDRTQPVSLFAFGLAGVSLMGLPPSGGFLAKWLLLEAAWQQAAWGLLVVIIIGSLLAAGYVFRVLAAAFVAAPDMTMRRHGVESAIAPADADAAHDRAAAGSARAVPRSMSLSALALSLASVVLGLAAAPLFELLAIGAPAIAGDVAAYVRDGEGPEAGQTREGER